MSSQDTLVGFVSGGDEPSLAPLATRIGDRYEILGLLGQGGMGTVYRVRDLHLDEVVALKQLRTGLLSVTGMLDRFRQEVKLARRITHPNVIRIFDLGDVDGQHFLTMELVEGRSLARRLRDGRLSTRETLAIVREVAAGVWAAHRAGVIHCDLKPDNVLLGAHRVAVADFGLARAAGAGGQIAGTPAYMAPEQVSGGEVGPAADQYALGAILYEALVGSPAWSGDDPRAVALARLQRPPPDPRDARREIDPALARVVVQCLAPDPRDRFPDLEAFDEALSAIGRASESIVPAPARSVPMADAVSVAVLVPRAPGDEAALALTLAEDLVDALGATRGLRVRPISALPKDLPADPQEVGRRLAVTVVVEGSLRRTESGVRWALRAVGAADGYQVWSGRYDVAAADVLSIVDRAAAALGSALAAPVPGRAVSAPNRAEVVDAYLRIRVLARSTWGIPTEEAFRQAEVALGTAPDDPLLLAAFAQVCANLAFRDADDSRRWIVRGREAATRALAAAPDLADGWLGLARNAWMEADFPAATAALCRALAINPGLSRAQEMLATILLEIGALDEALLRAEAVVTADPNAWQARADLVRANVYLRRWDRVDALLATAFDDLGVETNRRLQIARFFLWRRPEDPPGPPIPDPPSPVDTPQEGFVSFVRDWRATGIRPDLSNIDAGFVWARSVRSVRLRLIVLQVLAEAALAAGAPDRAMDAVGQLVEGGLLDLQWMDHAPRIEVLHARPEWAPLRAIVAARAREVRAAIA